MNTIAKKAFDFPGQTVSLLLIINIYHIYHCVPGIVMCLVFVFFPVWEQ